MKLYYFPYSTNCIPVLVTAKYLDLSLDLIQVDPLAGDTRTPEYLKMNPNAKVPLLVDGDFPLWESVAVMQYLAEKKPGNSLWSDDSKIRADITRWQVWHQAHWQQGTGALTWEYVVKPLAKLGDPDPVEIKKGEAGVERYGAVLNQHLEGRKYLVGDQVTLADFSVAVPLVYAEAAKLPIGDFKNMAAWYERIAALEAWQAWLPKLG